MKKYLLVLIVVLIGGVSENVAQNSGLGFNYQALVRKANGLLLANSDVTLRISLYPGQAATTPTWIETHNVHTDVSGCFGVTVGKGIRQANSVASSFKDINFAAVYYWMKIELQENNGFREISFSQLPSTPYSEVAHNVMMLAGMIVPFAGPQENIPDGWMLCDGSEVSRSDYVSLYRAIGVAWGAGNGSTTFNLPDLRGMFLRGVSGDSGNDEDVDSRTQLNDGGNVGNKVGSYQGDAIRNIKWGYTPPEDTGVAPGEEKELLIWSCGQSKMNWRIFDASKAPGVEVGADNRPKNVYVNYIIKF